ncbi:hypothetical protein MRX96_030479 [Rhipicephalus microplus]
MMIFASTAPAYVIAQLPHALSFCGCFTATSTTLTSQQHYIRPDKNVTCFQWAWQRVSNASRSRDPLAFRAVTHPDVPADILSWAALRSRWRPDVHGPPAAASFNYGQSSFNEILAPKTSGVRMMIFASTPLPTSSLSCLMPFPSVDASPLRRPL